MHGHVPDRAEAIGDAYHYYRYRSLYQAKHLALGSWATTFPDHRRMPL